eukprot:Lithocolla_globosa_v1_NODE_4833_length_1355_cov_26.310000.p1 type:complete len:423 gc:universal NODE_4833_length_1355_cov_26.310000:1314-46(-)
MGYLDGIKEAWQDLKTQDLDTTFAYTTPKTLRIRDRRLGYTYYTLLFLVSVYIIFYEIIWNQAYLAKEPPTGGSVRSSLLEPSTSVSDGNGVPGTPFDELPYCQQSGQTNDFGESYECLHWTAIHTHFPAFEEKAVFVTTRVSVTSQNLTISGCDVPGYVATDDKCAYKDLQHQSKTTYFVGDIEKYTLKVNHAVTGVTTGISESSNNLNGQLVYSEGKSLLGGYEVLKDFSEDSVRDIMSIAELLEAAGISLDDPSSADPSESIRYAGVTVVLAIDFSKPFLDKIEYQYIPIVIQGDDYKLLEYQYIGDEIKVFNRHGVRVVFSQTGTIGDFDLYELMLNLVVASALLSLATTSIEFVMLYVMSRRKLYRQFKIEDTPDFSDIADEIAKRGLGSDEVLQMIDQAQEDDVAKLFDECETTQN